MSEAESNQYNREIPIIDKVVPQVKSDKSDTPWYGILIVLLIILILFVAFYFFQKMKDQNNSGNEAEDGNVHYQQAKQAEEEEEDDYTFAQNRPSSVNLKGMSQNYHDSASSFNSFGFSSSGDLGMVEEIMKESEEEASTVDGEESA